LDPMKLRAGEELFRLICKVKYEKGNFSVKVDNDFEITDFEGNTISDLTLSYPIPVPSKESNILIQQFPNPFHNYTDLTYQLEEDANVRISVFDNMGKEVQQLLDNQQTKGPHTQRFIPNNLSPGLYIYYITITTKSEIYNTNGKLILQ
jgi:hypothetical protein